MRIHNEPVPQLPRPHPHAQALGIHEVVRPAQGLGQHCLGVVAQAEEIMLVGRWRCHSDLLHRGAVCKHLYACVRMQHCDFHLGIGRERLYQEAGMALHAPDCMWENAICAKKQLDFGW